jgi:hypothetical protein
MKSSIGTFVLRFMATALLIAPVAAAEAQGTGQSINLCPPSFRMTEHDGCQKSNDSKFGSFPAHVVKDDAAAHWRKEIVPLINDTPSEIQLCILRGPLTLWSTQDEAKAEISRCQRTVKIEKEQLNILHEAMLRDAKIENEARLRAANIANAKFFASWIAGILLLVLAIGFRAKIAAGLYNLFVGCIALRLRFNRSRKRFLDNAIKKAENRLG